MESAISSTISAQRGILFSQPAIVHRKVYAGRDILAKNSRFEPEYVDSRGYVPVEWWVMSKTAAENALPKPNEGITHLKLHNGDEISFPKAIEIAEQPLMGDFASKWPLTKILDIGGPAVTPSFSTTSEIPPIPCHVHAGFVCDGHCKGPGKLEAYFFPPLDVPPYNKTLGKVMTRLGIKAGVTKSAFLAGIKQFGKDDSLYGMLGEYEVRPWETWIVRQRVVHAPGPWLTLELQTPQDDFNMLSWRMGERIDAEEMTDAKEGIQLKGLPSEEVLFDEAVDWDINIDPDYESKWHRSCNVLEEGAWGRRMRLFYSEFYAEGIVLNSGCQWIGKDDGRPRAGIVWSGCGKVNGMAVSHDGWSGREFLVVPGYDVEISNSSEDSSQLIIFLIFPMVDVL